VSARRRQKHGYYIQRRLHWYWFWDLFIDGRRVDVGRGDFYHRLSDCRRGAKRHQKRMRALRVIHDPAERDT